MLCLVQKGVKSNLAENSCTVVGDCDIAVGRNENLVQATGTLSHSVRSHLIDPALESVPKKS